MRCGASRRKLPRGRAAEIEVICSRSPRTPRWTRFLIEFPFRVGPGTYDYVHVFTEAGADPIVEANFSVHLTHTISMTLVSDESVITEPIVINTVREFIDTKKAVFYPKGQHPSDLQIVTLGSADYDYKTEQYHKATDEQIADLLKKKVYWLGFRRGNQTTSVCIADPYDAVYLGVPTQRLEQAAAILGADGLVEVSGLYAHAGQAFAGSS